MPTYTTAVRVEIEADNQRDAFDSLDAFLDAVTQSTAPYGVVLQRPTFDEIRHTSRPGPDRHER